MPAVVIELWGRGFLNVAENRQKVSTTPINLKIVYFLCSSATFGQMSRKLSQYFGHSRKLSGFTTVKHRLLNSRVKKLIQEFLSKHPQMV